MLKIPCKVRIIKPFLKESNSKGVILSCNSSTQLYSVVLFRLEPPYRGYYTEGEMEVLDAEGS